jgi:hypothetical protein
MFITPADRLDAAFFNRVASSVKVIATQQHVLCEATCVANSSEFPKLIFVSRIGRSGIF